jgi:thiamine pyrophosphokinase
LGRNGDSTILKSNNQAQALVLANGAVPSRQLLQRALRRAQLFVCADGGANSAFKMRVTPDLIIGDFDSIHAKTLQAFRTVQMKKIKEQNSTDLEKSLTELINRSITQITVLGATGGRFDHAIGNLSALAKFSDKAHITFLDDNGVYRHVGRRIELEMPKGTTISLIPLSKCSGIVTTGLKWNLTNESLELGVRESTSNAAIASSVTISVRRGDLIAYIHQSSFTLMP